MSNYGLFNQKVWEDFLKTCEEHPETWDSYQWAKKLKVFNIGEFKAEKDLKPDECLILDPDGWDRKNLESSYAENITKQEFLNRVFKSTVIAGKEWNKPNQEA